jgi:hypothetical protein
MAFSLPPRIQQPGCLFLQVFLVWIYLVSVKVSAHTKHRWQGRFLDG